MRLRFDFTWWRAKELAEACLFLQLVIGAVCIAMIYSGRPGVHEVPGVWLMFAITVVIWMIVVYIVSSIDLCPRQPPPNGRKHWPVPPASSFSTGILF